MNKRYKVAQKGFPSNNLLNINAVVELDDESVLKDVIYIEFFEALTKNNIHIGYDKDNKIAVKYNSHSLRVLKHNLKSLVVAKKSIYKKYSNSKLSNKTESELVKEVTLGYSKEKYWINIEVIGGKKFGVSFDIFEIKSLIEALELISNECDSILFKYQRAFDKEKNRNDN